MGALTFLTEYQNEYAGAPTARLFPASAPWVYERISCWNYDAVDPGIPQFFPEGAAGDIAGIDGDLLSAERAVCRACGFA